MKFFSKKIKTINDIPANKIVENENFKNADLSNQKLEYIIFNNVDFRDATFENSTFEGVLFKNCNLNGANFENTKFLETKKEKELEKKWEKFFRKDYIKILQKNKSLVFNEADEDTNLNFKNAKLNYISFYPGLMVKNSNFENTNIKEAGYEYVTCQNSCLKNTNFNNTNSKRYIFKNCDLRKADFFNSESSIFEIENCDLREAQLKEFILDDISTSIHDKQDLYHKETLPWAPSLYCNKYSSEDIEDAKLWSNIIAKNKN